MRSGVDNHILTSSSLATRLGSALAASSLSSLASAYANASAPDKEDRMQNERVRETSWGRSHVTV